MGVTAKLIPKRIIQPERATPTDAQSGDSLNKALIAGLLALGVVVVPAVVAQETGPAAAAGAVVPGSPSIRTLAKGLTFEATFTHQISSKTSRVGDFLTAVTVADVRDAAGTVIFPAKSVANVEIMEINGTQKENADGTLLLVLRSVNVGNETFRMRPATDSASASIWTRAPAKMESSMKRSAKTSGIVGRAPKGSLVGENLVVVSGTPVTFELAEAVTATS
jgi:hypothetical protein